MMKIIPSILSADFSRLSEEVRDVERDVDLIHVDVMDGHFVPNLSMGANVVSALKKSNAVKMDVHLMVEEPAALIPSFIEAGADMISVHVEACRHLHRVIRMIKESGIAAGVALNPATPVDWVRPILDELDYLLIMTVDPGFGGQSFIPSMPDKIREAAQLIDTRKQHVAIEVDGGINTETLPLCRKAGASLFVAGSAIYGHHDRHQAIQGLLKSSTSSTGPLKRK
ncbi:ribulose-phosphate 3-epimerase [Sporolactobacillus sp. THM19-2]|uniref:ribulose-phosphate 3-epimerase n=1 Tax=Sporolactobacillus sp. THM19-2 TaxID=2511171 RepID=UPI001021F73D|nr:ribulose-phosphate 3-epimerase [Sporolactobacillus sp. THM19-2]RYL88148.1 ribulose-phosphate 3-epimerase [Sporolactobacillus sp. THM19-2]